MMISKYKYNHNRREYQSQSSSSPPYIRLVQGEKRLPIGSGLALHQYHLQFHPQHHHHHPHFDLNHHHQHLCCHYSNGNHDLDDHPNNWDIYVTCYLKACNLICNYSMIIEYNKIYRMLCIRWYGLFVCTGFFYNHCMAGYLQYAGKYAWPSPDIWNITAAGIAVAILQ